MKWKKVISILLAAVLCMSFLVGCGDNTNETSNTVQNSNEKGPKEAEKAVKTINDDLVNEQGTNDYAYQFKEKVEGDQITYYNYVNESYNPEEKSDSKTTLSFLYDGTKFIGIKINADYRSNYSYYYAKYNLEEDSIFGFTQEERKGFVEAIGKEDYPIGDYICNEYKSKGSAQYSLIHKDYAN